MVVSKSLKEFKKTLKNYNINLEIIKTDLQIFF